MTSSSTLLDYRGRPIRSSVLGRELAAPRLGSIRSPLSPMLGGITPEKLTQVLHNAQQGDFFEFLNLAKTMELRWAHYFSVLSTRKRAVLQLPRMVIAPTDDPRDVRIAEELHTLVQRPAFGRGLMAMLDGLAKGYSVTEILWDKTTTPWKPYDFRWRNPQHFRFDRQSLTELHKLDETAPLDGIPLEAGKYVVFEPQLVSGLPGEGGLAWQCAALYLCASFALKDWMSFADVFGLPIRLGRVPEHADEPFRNQMLSALRMIGSDAAAVISDSMNIEFVDAGRFAGGDTLFERLLEWLNKQVSKVVLGQTMTSEDGSSLAQATVHDHVRKDIRNADAAHLSDVVTRDVAEIYTKINYGTLDAYPQIVFVTDEPEDLTTFAASLIPFIREGLTVEASQIRDRFRLDAPAEGAEVLGGRYDCLASKRDSLAHKMHMLAQQNAELTNVERALSQEEPGAAAQTLALASSTARRSNHPRLAQTIRQSAIYARIQACKRRMRLRSRGHVWVQEPARHARNYTDE